MPRTRSNNMHWWDSSHAAFYAVLACLHVLGGPLGRMLSPFVWGVCKATWIITIWHLLHDDSVCAARGYWRRLNNTSAMSLELKVLRWLPAGSWLMVKGLSACQCQLASGVPSIACLSWGGTKYLRQVFCKKFLSAAASTERSFGGSNAQCGALFLISCNASSN